MTATRYTADGLVRRLTHAVPEPVTLDPLVAVALITAFMEILRGCRDTPTPAKVLRVLRTNPLLPGYRRRVRQELRAACVHHGVGEHSEPILQAVREMCLEVEADGVLKGLYAELRVLA